MSNLPAVMPLSEADYELIESAVMETVRGRWFLAEYARRNRHADTAMLLAAIDRLTAAIESQRSVQATDQIRFDLCEMGQSIARAKTEVAALASDPEFPGSSGAPREPLPALIAVTETTISKILGAAEQVEDIVWTLREQGLEADLCDVLDAKATEIYSACSEQDLILARIGKLVEVLNDVGERIHSLLAGSSLAQSDRKDAAAQAVGSDNLSMSTDEEASANGSPQELAAATAGDRDHRTGDADIGRPAMRDEDLSGPQAQPRSGEAGDQPQGQGLPATGAEGGRAFLAGDALRRLESLTPDEKIALFS
jgi:hypothetical protein